MYDLLLSYFRANPPTADIRKLLDKASEVDAQAAARSPTRALLLRVERLVLEAQQEGLPMSQLVTYLSDKLLAEDSTRGNESSESVQQALKAIDRRKWK